MNKGDAGSWAASGLAVLAAAGIAWAGSHNNATTAFGLPLFAACVFMAFAIQWLAFVPSYLARTEKYYDLTGSLTFIALTVLALVRTARFHRQSLVLAAMVLLWALRLGLYLFHRVRKAGEDKRFQTIKTSASRFFLAWTLQALWVSVTAAPALVAIAAKRPGAFGALGIVGLCLWILGFFFEVVADWQKSRFSANPANRGHFITTGLWSLSRHPNYFGEIVLWVGVATVAFPALERWSLLTLVSPLFVALLLTRVSGVPLLEAAADANWGGQEEYERYKRSTPLLIPKLPLK